jgi:hypothetical protein
MNVEDRLRDALHAKAEAIRVPPAELRRRSASSAARTRWVAGIGAVAAALLVVVAVVVVANAGQDEPTRVSTGGAQGSTRSTVTSTTIDAERRCSASTEGVGERTQEGLPPAVATARRDIIAAATSCDLAKLRSLMADNFTGSFGGGGPEEIIAMWAEDERAGGDILRTLVAVLEMPFGERESEGAGYVVWPSAFAYDNWSDIPQPDRDALGSLYSADEIRSFEEFGGYIGYRVVMTTTGAWTAFVAGD